MIDAFILAPYYWALRIRHRLYDKGILKSFSAEVPTICIGNVTAGGTGKTPHTEMILKTLLSEEEFREKNISVLSRGYKRKTKGFRYVTIDGTASQFGDEPLQIKKKFAAVTVAVCKDRLQGVRFLAKPERILTDKKARKCDISGVNPSGLVILDDAFQYRALKPKVSIVLVDFNRPTFEDHLLPVGKLRDLPQRISCADMVIVSKCPHYLEPEEREAWASSLGIRDFDAETCAGKSESGKTQYLFFTTIDYCPMEPVFVESETRYLYAQRLIVFSGIADDTPLVRYLSDSFKVVRHFNYPDHHKFNRADIAEIRNAAISNPTALIATTDKDSQRIKDVSNLPDVIRTRLFRIPIQVSFLSEKEKGLFKETLIKLVEAD